MFDIKDKSIHVDCDGRVIKMSMDRCKAYRILDEVRGLVYENWDHGEATTQGNDEKIQEEINGGDGFWDFNDLTPDMSPIFVIRVHSQTDPRTKMEDFTQTKKAEIERL